MTQFPEGSARILLMDDEEIILKTTGPLLQRMGYEIDVSRNGEEALALYRRAMEESRPYAVVIMDLTIPSGMGGKEAVIRLREMDPDVQAIATSGYFEDSFLENQHPCGFAGILAKPYKATDLDVLIQSLIHRDRTT